ncbi:chaperone NapD [Methylobacterium oxalidis]|uniref:Chaperone NapD n=1 Tax=Methylobacterium oxalidis TaxID=944322 RepID=A0A512JB69_9HYPH|nr:chaperone NapD [Methylobacterium oxalidis]GEP07115.1 glutamate synthase subunit beta [Methylobacterium oxalidis]GJE34004.1 Chaperone NapD [Methylobacterium oxalidis]GLS66182.1 glutamate synthase subunit beta [Methylobacterium oxalidis]
MPATECPSRREILTGRLSDHPVVAEAHVSSLVVHVRPEQAASARVAMECMPGVEIHAAAAGKLIVTLETESDAEIVTRLNAISLLDGVMSAALVFHHVEADAGSAAGRA